MSQRVLVIEGDPVLRDGIGRLLIDHGHQVELAANGAEAAEWSRIYACPRPTEDQEKALKLCFDMVNPQDADLVILLERHGVSEAKRLSLSVDNIRRPIIAISRDHADLCDAVFEIASETSWRKIASLVHRSKPLASGPRSHAEMALSSLVEGVSPQAHEYIFNETGFR